MKLYLRETEQEVKLGDTVVDATGREWIVYDWKPSVRDRTLWRIKCFDPRFATALGNPRSDARIQEFLPAYIKAYWRAPNGL